MLSLRTLIAALFLVATAQAFTPMSRSAAAASTTALSFGFLKELGLEKPSWLPDFGGSKAKEPAPAPTEVVDDDSAAAVAEGEAATKEE